MTCRPGTSSISSPERWIKAGVFEAPAHDLRAMLRIAEGRKERPTAAIIDSRTLQSTPEKRKPRPLPLEALTRRRRSNFF
jgi:hypothetical protein